RALSTFARGLREERQAPTYRCSKTLPLEVRAMRAVFPWRAFRLRLFRRRAQSIRGGKECPRLRAPCDNPRIFLCPTENQTDRRYRRFAGAQALSGARRPAGFLLVFR